MNKLTKTLQSARSLFSNLTLVALLLSTLSGCVTAVIAGVAVATVDVIQDRRTVGEYVDDASIEVKSKNYVLSTKELRSSARIKTDSWNGILLLTGEIDNEQLKQEVVTFMKTIQGVRQVVDETTVTGKTALLARTHDAWITSKVKSRLVLKTGIDANRVKVITTRATVYLMGIVTQEEANKATELTREVRGVARVVKVFEYTDA
ncbi:BON domain-containing protein [Arenicella sp.]|nr:BON domain-containing protein [Arenicella sp.]